MLLQVPNIGQLSPNHDTDLGKSVVVEQEEECTHNRWAYMMKVINDEIIGKFVQLKRIWITNKKRINLKT